MNQQEIDRARIAADVESYMKKGGTILRCRMGDTANPEVVSGSQRAKIKSNANKHQINGAKNGSRKPKKPSSRWHDPSHKNERDF